MLRFRYQLWLLPIAFVLAVYLARHFMPAPEAIARIGVPGVATSVGWFRDSSWLDSSGVRQLEQTVFDEVFHMIELADSFVLVDMFLFNAWQGPVAESHRALSEELVSVLRKRQLEVPGMTVIVITDPINTVYGGLKSQHVESLRQGGIDVVLTDLTRLQDSNPVYSALWRGLIAPFGNRTDGGLPNPLGSGQVSLRSWLSLLNFKANHRKLIVADDGEGRLRALVTSANPHDGSSAHRNVAVRFDGPAVIDVLDSERAVLELSNAEQAVQRLDKYRDSVRQADSPDEPETAIQVQLVTESGIRDTVLEVLRRSSAGDEIELSMFYLSHREVIKSLKAAANRGVRVRALLDVNSDAFGRRKNGVPNVPVAAELMRAGVQVRWCATRGEQCHEKSLLLRASDELTLITGSGNFTRRNLDDYNLETDVVLTGRLDDALLNSISENFDSRWNNDGDRTYSTRYDNHANDSLWLTLQYRVMEATGLGTF